MPSALKAWIEASRPKTLPAALVPVMLGSACAATEGHFLLLPAFFALLFALFVQITCNFSNDYGDYVKGADTAERLGPARAVASGWISPAKMKRGILISAGLSFISGLALVHWGGWWLIGVGIISLIACICYTSGPFPLAYNGLGDLFVIVFFGFVAVAFTAYVQCGYFPCIVWPASLTCGLLATNILVVNNSRDMETDAKAGKRTTVVRFGRGFARVQYVASLLISLLLPAISVKMGFNLWSLFPLALVPIACLLGYRFWHVRDPRDYNPLLGKTAAFLLLYGLFFSVGLVLGRAP
ncbi:MAG: 1,4-dihydroxy-2-naphthoate polyprenyltransferase [Puniceicoccales bacterium]|jgi:1,4-dihydroxy-2-naphthoate octaprenyltransferase|nr:1,4-dihydroxy-2-naphthoate polyprenyltransferase [Puniceicoccales bacterium]